jgi:hypothetical protein
MTHTEIENMFDRMRLPYNPVKKSRFRNFNGHWTIPGENYEFRIVAIVPRDNWGIEITRSMGAESNPVYLLSGEDGITFIQQVICDKFDINVDRLFGKNWQHHQERLGKYMHKRIEYLSLHQLKRA